MNYTDAETIALANTSLVGKPILNKMAALDDRKITSILISPKEKIREVFSSWWYNGKDNKKAALEVRNSSSFRVFLMSCNISKDDVIYYFDIETYLTLAVR